MGGDIKLGIGSHLPHADRNPVIQEALLKPKLIHSDCVEPRNVANWQDVTYVLGRDVLTAEPVPPCGKASSSPSKQLLKINVPLESH